MTTIPGYDTTWFDCLLDKLRNHEGLNGLRGLKVLNLEIYRCYDVWTTVEQKERMREVTREIRKIVSQKRE